MTAPSGRLALVLAALFLVVIPARGEDVPAAPGAQKIRQKQLIKQIQEMSRGAAERFGIDPKKAKSFIEQLIERIRKDDVISQEGVTRDQLSQFKEALVLSARYFKLKCEVGQYPEGTPERLAADGELLALKRRRQEVLSGAGELKNVFQATLGAMGDRKNDEAADRHGGGRREPVPYWGSYLQGSVANKSGRYAEAVESFDEALRADPRDASSWSGRSAAMYKLDRFADAYSDARQALTLDPNDRGALAVMRFSEGRLGSASSAASAAAEASAGARSLEANVFTAGSSGPAYSAAAPARTAAIAPEQAKASAASSSSDHAAREAANALKLGDLGGALAQADRALQLEARNLTALSLRAAILARMREYDKAAAGAQAGLDQSPGSLPLLRTKVYAQLRGGRYVDAVADAHALIALAPRDAYAYALRAHAYGSLGDRSGMLSDLRRAAELDGRFQQTLLQAEGLQIPSDSDILFLFPGEAASGPSAPKPAAPGAVARRFGLVAGGGVVGGIFLALGLLSVRGPGIREHERPSRDSAPGRPNGLIRGQYEISRQIGAGGMGVVFEGLDRSLGRRVAIKKMREELRSDARERARFVAEARTVAALHHRNIVEIYAIVEDGEDVFLVFEYVEGKTVHELVQSAGPLDCAQALRIVRAAAAALEFAHGRGVIHRDMKPSNMMVDASGCVKLMDFGIARAAKDAMTRCAMTNTVVGTPPYMAPEAEQGQVRRESDVYSLAVCAYEMLCGRLPFAGAGGGMSLNKINMSYVPPSRQTAGLPEGSDDVFRRAFDPDPEKRWRTPQAFADALAAVLPVASVPA